MKTIIKTLIIMLLLVSCRSMPIDDTLPDIFVKKADKMYKIYVPNELRTDISFNLYQQRHLLISYDSTARYQLKLNSQHLYTKPKGFLNYTSLYSISYTFVDQLLNTQKSDSAFAKSDAMMPYSDDDLSYFSKNNIVKSLVKKIEKQEKQKASQTLSTEELKQYTIEKQEFMKQKGVLIGGSQDEHGCLIAAGYTWSSLQGTCVRLFETAIRLDTVINGDETLSAFIILSEDKKSAELFLPNEKGSIILEQNKNNKNEWLSEHQKLVYHNDNYEIYFME